MSAEVVGVLELAGGGVASLTLRGVDGDIGVLHKRRKYNTVKRDVKKT